MEGVKAQQLCLTPIRGCWKETLLQPLLLLLCAYSASAETTRVGINTRCSHGARGRKIPALDRAEPLTMSPLAFLSMKHSTKLEAVKTSQENKPNYVMQAARRWRGQMALALQSLGKVPVHPSCKAPIPTAQAGFTSCSCCSPVLPQPGLSSENSTKAGRRGRRKREPFQEKGGQLAPAMCHGGRELREPCRPGVALHAGTCKPWPLPQLSPWSPAEPWGHSSHPLLTVKYLQMQPRARGHSHALQSQRTPGAGRAGVPPAPLQQQPTEGPSFQIQLPTT